MNLRNAKFIATLLICVGTIVFAAETKVVPDANKYKILNAYRKALAAQGERDAISQGLCAKDAVCSKKQQELAELVKEFQTASDEAAKAMSLPAGTQFQIELPKDSVTPVLPAEKK